MSSAIQSGRGFIFVVVVVVAIVFTFGDHDSAYKESK